MGKVFFWVVEVGGGEIKDSYLSILLFNYSFSVH